MISVPDYDEEVVTVNVGRKKQTNQKLFERFYKPQEGDANDSIESDTVEDGMALV